jgi:hypothetical protein
MPSTSAATSAAAVRRAASAGTPSLAKISATKPFSDSVRVALSDIPAGVSRFIPALGYTRRGAEGIPGSHATHLDMNSAA